MKSLTDILMSDLYIPYAHCYWWKPELVELKWGADLMISIGYFSILLTLFYFVLLANQALEQQIRERELAEAKIQQLNEQLEVRVAERTRELEASMFHVRDLAERMELAIEAAQMGACDWDILTQKITCNDNHIKLLGYIPGAAEYAYADWERRVHPEDLDRVKGAIELAMAMQTDYSSEYRVIWADGSIHWISGFGRFYYNTDGEPMRMTDVAEDITDQKQAEQALQQSEARYRSLIESVAQIVWQTDAEGQSVTEQLSWSKFTGQSYAEYSGWGWLDAIHPEDRLHTEQLWATSVANQTICELEYRLRRSDGEYRAMNVRGVPLFDTAGNVREWIGIHTDITEAKQAELALAASETRLQLTIEAAGLGTFDGNLLTKELAWNTQGETLMGYAPGAATSYSFSDFQHRIHPEDLELVNAQVSQAMIAQTDSISEYRVIWADGSIHWHRGFGRFVYDRDGVPSRILGTFEDITERKQAELALQASEERMQLAIDGARMGTYDWNLVTQKIVTSAYFNQLMGYAPDAEFGYADWEHRLHPDDFTSTTTALQQGISDRRDIELEYRIIWLDDSIHWIAVFGRCYYDSDGRPMRMTGVGYDITARKHSEQALVESEARFRSTFEQAAVGVAHVAIEGQWLRVNQKLCAIVGYTEAELLDKAFQDITYPEDLATDLEYVRQLLAGDIQTYVMEKRYIHKLGQLVWINLTVSLRRDHSGAPIYLIAVVEAIDDRKHAEFALEEKTIKLAETALLVKQRNQDLDQFAHIVSHDLKAPLRAISNLSTWIEDDLEGQIPAETQDHLILMRSRVARMEGLINGLLEYARIGNTPANLTTFKIEDLLAEIIDSVSIPPSFTIDLPTNLPTITTHRILLSQVLANLVGNACKHHNRSDGLIQVTAQLQGEIWTFTVADDGAGISPEDQERVFGIFQTLTARDRQENTGIGLSIVKKIVESQGGNITLESDLGRGTTFRFTWMAEHTKV